MTTTEATKPDRGPTLGLPPLPAEYPHGDLVVLEFNPIRPR